MFRMNFGRYNKNIHILWPEVSKRSSKSKSKINHLCLPKLGIHYPYQRA